MPLSSGIILQNRYRIARLLGQGGMGSVYRAWDTRLNLSVAVKELLCPSDIPPEQLDGLREQFHQEARILARLKHPNLVHVTDSFEENGNAYLVMDFVEGESLAERLIHEGAQPEARVVEWGLAILNALNYCHNQKIIHRDIKPQNLIICKDGRIVLVDFGLVKLMNPNDPRTHTLLRGMGTPTYAPPEQYDSTFGHTDPRTDLYSLGATLYHALTGMTPPTATHRIIEPQSLKAVREIIPQVTPQTQMVIMRALELRPDHRYTTANAMATALTPITTPISHQPPTNKIPPDDPGNRPGPVAPPYPPPPARKSNLPFLLIGGGLSLLVVCTLLGVGALFILPGLLTFTPTDVPLTREIITLTPNTPYENGTTPEITPYTEEPPTLDPIYNITLTPPPDLPLRIAYAHGDVGDSDIYIAQADGSTPICLACTAEIDEAEPAWSPDQQQFVYQSNGNTSYDLWIGNADTGELFLWYGQPDLNEREPDWSPDGNRIVFRANPISEEAANENGDLYLLDIQTLQVIDLYLRGRAPVWSPDGRSLAYMSNETGHWEIYIYSLTNGSITILTNCGNTQNHCRWPAWQPDGRSLLINTTEEKNVTTPIAIFSVSLQNGQFTQITSASQSGRPDMSASGLIIYNATEGIEVINSDSSNRHILIPSSNFADWAPTWSK